MSSASPLKSVFVALLLCAVTAGSAQAYTTMYDCRSAWPARSIPVQYHVNTTPPPALTLDQVRQILQASFDTWSEPCCSSFRAQDAGTTTATAENNSDNLYVASFELSSWPRSLGDVNSTLGVTLVSVDGSCNIISSDTVFNGVTWNFINGSPHSFSDADLQSIATHEFGHFLGLGHTQVSGATMYPSYDGGTGARTLSQDDIDGVCYLYTKSCSCSSNSDCAAGEQCISSSCEVPPCSSDGDCDTGLVCNTSTGACVIPPCHADSDCVAGQVCGADGVCVTNADCPICGECQQNSDCGVNGVCIPAGYVADTAVCTQWCTSSADCPGNSDCFEVPTDTNPVDLCFNNDADVNGPCPSGYVCQSDGGGGTTNPCDTVTCPSGQVCNPSTGVCQGDGGGGGGGGGCTVCAACTGQSANECGTDGTCLSFINGPTVCSVPCGADGSCPGDSACFQLQDDTGATQNWCLNSTAASAGICESGWSCTSTPVDLCAGVTCGVGQACNSATGNCESTGDGGGGGGGGGTADDAPDAGGSGGGLGDVTPDRGRTTEPTGGTGQNGGGNGSGCSVAGGTAADPGLLAAPFGVGLLAWRRRRRTAGRR